MGEEAYGGNLASLNVKIWVRGVGKKSQDRSAKNLGYSCETGTEREPLLYERGKHGGVQKRVGSVTTLRKRGGLKFRYLRKEGHLIWTVRAGDGERFGTGREARDPERDFSEGGACGKPIRGWGGESER